jgi:arsenate reductase-like glutaredoxin family protein
VETVDAKKNFLALKDAKQSVLKGIDEILSAKGKNVVRIAMKDKPTDEQLAAALIGPTGRLRAPAAKVGKTLLVGFSEDVYRSTFR